MKKILFFVCVLLALPALAERMPLPADTPPSFKAECGACHLAYPPALLGASDWRRIMSRLEAHFGSDAWLDGAARLEITRFLERNARPVNRSEGLGELPRITQSEPFVRKHREVPKRFWRDPRVKSAANCEACHRDAAQGRFSEHDILIPELRD